MSYNFTKGELESATQFSLCVSRRHLVGVSTLTPRGANWSFQASSGLYTLGLRRTQISRNPLIGATNVTSKIKTDVS